MRIFSSAVIVSCFFYSSVAHAAPAGDTLFAKALQPCGRAAQAAEGLELIGSAVHFGFSFTGSECRLFVSVTPGQDHNYLQYEMDGVYQKRVKISREGKDPVVISAARKGKHTVWVYKATEAQTGPIFIQRIEAKNIRSLRPGPTPRIEFIGNSITCGAAADASELPCGSGLYHDQHNAYYAYGPRVARALKVNYLLSSVSGIGIYRNWNSNGPTMPQVYEKTDLQNDSTRNWNFEQYRPDVISIALGTNDMSNGDGKSQRQPFDSTAFVQAYIGFVQLVKSKYPKAQIALLSSPMTGGDRMILLQNCLKAVKTNIDQLYPAGKSVALFFFKPIKAGGCTGHPNIEDHGIMADELIPFFKRLLK